MEKLDSLQIWHQLYQYRCFNVFFGAGISRNHPSNAPVWREIQKLFISSLFDIIQEQQWMDREAVSIQKDVLINYPFRPEQFWELIQSHSSIEFVIKCLKLLLDFGMPNSSHKILANGMKNRVISNLVTTNFDEYMEPVLPDFVPIVSTEYDAIRITQSSNPSSNKNPGIFLKLHGTLSKSESLQFSIRHLVKLPDWKRKLLRDCLSGKPLLIAGYSGYDEDIFPVLKNISQSLPLVVVIIHPGSSPHEPIRKLVNFPSNVELVEANIHEVLSSWVDNSFVEKPIDWETATNGSGLMYEWTLGKALSSQPLPWIPYIISVLNAFSGNERFAIKYSEIADDALYIPQGASSITDDLRAKIIMNDVFVLTKTGMSFYATIKHRSYYSTLGDTSLLGSLEVNLRRAWAQVLNNNSTEEELKEAEKWAQGVFLLGQFGLIKEGNIVFHACWCLGRLRDRQGRKLDAMQAYLETEKFWSSAINNVTLYSFGSFCLDYGSCLFEYARDEIDEKILSKAHQLFAIAEGIAKTTGDHLTHAQSLIMLAKMSVFAGNFEGAENNAQEAVDVAKKTGDDNLQKRADEVNKWVLDFIARHSK